MLFCVDYTLKCVLGWNWDIERLKYTLSVCYVPLKKLQDNLDRELSDLGKTTKDANQGVFSGTLK